MMKNFSKSAGLLSLLLVIASFMPNALQAQTYPDGTLLRGKNDFKVYLVHNGTKRWLKNIDIFNSYNLDWKDIQAVSDKIINAIPPTKLIQTKGDIKVYLLNDLGYRRHITNPDVFNSYAFNWNEIAQVSPEELSAYSESYLIKEESNPNIYFIQGDSKQLVTNVEAFYKNDFDWNAIFLVNEKDLKSYPQGENITPDIKVIAAQKSPAESPRALTPNAPQPSALPQTITVITATSTIPTLPPVVAQPVVPQPITPLSPILPQNATSTAPTTTSTSSGGAAGTTPTSSSTPAPATNPASTQNPTPTPNPTPNPAPSPAPAVNPAPPQIFINAYASDIGPDNAIIKWTTNAPTNPAVNEFGPYLPYAEVEYGLSTSYGLSVSGYSIFSNNYSFTLPHSLRPNTLYHFRLKLKDGSTGIGSAGVSQDYTFTTAPPPAPADVTPPVITSVFSSYIAESRATINWNTNEQADSSVEYGTTTSYGSITNDPLAQSTTIHLIDLKYLNQGTLYHYRVKSKDNSGNLAVSDDYTFTTLTLTPPPDTTPPQIFSVFASNIGPNSAQIRWSTNKAGFPEVEFGVNASYGLSVTANNMRLSEDSLPLSGLQPNTLYHFRLKFKDTAGNVGVSPDYTLTTPAA